MQICHKKVKGGGGGIHTLKQHLASIRGQIVPCAAPPKQTGDIKELLEKFEKFEEDKARKKAIEVEIGRKRILKQMMADNPNFDYDGSSFILCIDASNPFRFVPPSLESIQEKGKGIKKGGIKSYFSPSSPSNIAHGPRAHRSQIQPTLDDHWKKELREIVCDYIAIWWYDVDIPFNVAYSLYYEPMLDAIIVVGKGFKGPSMHELRGSLLHKEVMSNEEYLKDFKNSWVKTRCTIMLDGWTKQKNHTIINFLLFCPQGTMFLKSVNASDKVKNAHLLFQVLDEVVEQVGVANVVQTIIDNAFNYVLAGKMLEEKCKNHLFDPMCCTLRKHHA